MKPVLYRYRDSESVIKAMEGYTPGEGWTPLYDQAALDAAVAAEREACKEACRKIAAQYPTDVWPEDVESLDCKSARMARLTAANCEREIDMRSNA
jgi:hypothetical protein